nr:HAD family hydrolase [Streptomyces sp. SID14478]
MGNHHVRPDTLLVTSDATKKTVPVADETGSRRELSGLVGLVKGAKFVLWDFDGPICRLFVGDSAKEVARRQEVWLESHGRGDVLTAEDRRAGDPHAALIRLASRQPGSDLVVELEKRLAREELAALPTALPTSWVDPLIQTWRAVGTRHAVTTNNSADPVRLYLEGRGLADCFERHIYGRTSDLGLLKPHPYCLNRALTAMGAAPEDALMIGDAVTDYEAAQAAGVAFLGFARNERKEALLREAGAVHVVHDLSLLLKILRGRS